MIMCAILQQPGVAGYIALATLHSSYTMEYGKHRVLSFFGLFTDTVIGLSISEYPWWVSKKYVCNVAAGDVCACLMTRMTYKE